MHSHENLSLASRTLLPHRRRVVDGFDNIVQDGCSAVSKQSHTVAESTCTSATSVRRTPKEKYRQLLPTKGRHSQLHVEPSSEQFELFDNSVLLPVQRRRRELSFRNFETGETEKVTVYPEEETGLEDRRLSAMLQDVPHSRRNDDDCPTEPTTISWALEIIKGSIDRATQLLETLSDIQRNEHKSCENAQY